METNRAESTPSTTVKCDSNRDPITGAPGAHPVGVGTGAAGGGIAGAVIGSAFGGPIGAAVGAVVGAVSGGLAGKSAAESINPTVEHEFWRREYANLPYVKRGMPYEQYGPAFQYGWESRASHSGKAFAEVEAQLGRDWATRRETSELNWSDARDATRDAWQRVDNATCGNACSSA